MFGFMSLCRPGFEAECAGELSDRVSALGGSGFARAKPGVGFVLFELADEANNVPLWDVLEVKDLIFSRQVFWTSGINTRNSPDVSGIVDNIGILLRKMAKSATLRSLTVGTPDTDEAKECAGVCKAFERDLPPRLRTAGFLDEAGSGHLMACVVLLNKATYLLGLTKRGPSSPWPTGIPRLRFPKGAPSRSALKLEEAFCTFLTESQRSEWLRAGVAAVDLGAAPGGWSWVLTQAGVHVTAVDNGLLAPELLATGLVEHRQEDGFRFRPRTAVHWVVCDIVDRPMRVVDTMCIWFREKRCQHAIFNLKLPMKQKRQEVARCLEKIREAAPSARIFCKQLYHDRDEVTVFVDLPPLGF